MSLSRLKLAPELGLGWWSWHGDQHGFWILDQRGLAEIGDRGGLCLDR